MEQELINIKIQDKIPCQGIRNQTGLKNIADFEAKGKLEWIDPGARMNGDGQKESPSSGQGNQWRKIEEKTNKQDDGETILFYRRAWSGAEKQKKIKNQKPPKKNQNNKKQKQKPTGNWRYMRMAVSCKGWTKSCRDCKICSVRDAGQS